MKNKLMNEINIFARFLNKIPVESIKAKEGRKQMLELISHSLIRDEISMKHDSEFFD
jgi:hypothetical protein